MTFREWDILQRFVFILATTATWLCIGIDSIHIYNSVCFGPYGYRLLPSGVSLTIWKRKHVRGLKKKKRQESILLEVREMAVCFCPLMRHLSCPQDEHKWTHQLLSKLHQEGYPWGQIFFRHWRCFTWSVCYLNTQPKAIIHCILYIMTTIPFHKWPYPWVLP